MVMNDDIILRSSKIAGLFLENPRNAIVRAKRSGKQDQLYDDAYRKYTLKEVPINAPEEEESDDDSAASDTD
ncbi:unnamed protein product [Candida parapsilosis]